MNASPSSLTFPTGINNAGQIVGYANRGTDGFLYSGGTFRTYEINIPGATDAAPYDINNAGDIVGTYALVVPEPGTLVLFGVGLLGLVRGWRHSRAAGAD